MPEKLIVRRNYEEHQAPADVTMPDLMGIAHDDDSFRIFPESQIRDYSLRTTSGIYDRDSPGPTHISAVTSSVKFPEDCTNGDYRQQRYRVHHHAELMRPVAVRQ